MTDMTEESTGFDGARFRQVLGHFPTGVTIVATATPNGPVGMAIGSFTSVSLDPPQVLFCAGRTSTTWPHIRERGSFSVSVLAEDQEHLSRVFSSKTPDKFAEIGWHRSGAGDPFIEGALAWIQCRVADVVESGDHSIIIGDVQELELAREGRPLVFFRGGYGRLEP